MRILLLSGGLQGLSCGESLRECGHTVDVVAHDLQIRKSRFFETVYPDGDEISLERLLAILRKKHYDVVIPMGDKNVAFLSENGKEIEDAGNCKCACPDKQLLEEVEDKHRFMAFCERNGVPHPKTIVLASDNLEEAAKEISFPALIKPDFSVGARGITRVNNIEELRRSFPEVSKKYGACTLQELIENEDYYYNVMLYRSADGRFLGQAISKIVRMYPVHAGSSSCLITVENEELLNICKECLDKLGWVGMADFDVLQRLDNKKYKIIEINARVPASLRAAQVSGVNFPEIIVRDAMGQEVPQYKYKAGKTLRYLGIDIMWLLKSPKRFKATPGWLQFFGKNIYYQDIFKQDASTWWTWLAEGLMKISKRNKRIR